MIRNARPRSILCRRALLPALIALLLAGPAWAGQTCVLSLNADGTVNNGGAFADSDADAFACGQSAQAEDASSTAIGALSEALGTSSIAIGSFTDANGDGIANLDIDLDPTTDAAVGGFAVSESEASTALGFSSFAAGLDSTAVGAVSVAFGLQSTAVGAFSLAAGDESAAFGFESLANNVRATALGAGSFASGASATAAGFDAVASGAGSVALGGAFDRNGNGVIDANEQTFATAADWPWALACRTARGQDPSAMLEQCSTAASPCRSAPPSAVARALPVSVLAWIYDSPTIGIISRPSGQTFRANPGIICITRRVMRIWGATWK